MYARWDDVAKNGYQEISSAELQELIEEAEETSGSYCICVIALVKIENNTFYYELQEFEC